MLMRKTRREQCVPFAIGQRFVGGSYPCLVIAEIAQAHDGSLGTAHAYIDAVAGTGADAVKFQTHIAAAESTIHEPWRIKFSMQDATRFDYWKRMEFTEEQWMGLRKHAEEAGLIFLSSPFSSEAADLLIRVGIKAWKIASGEVSNVVMFEKISATRLPLIISTGMSPLQEIDATVERIKAHDLRFALMQCTTAYPCPAEKVGLNLIPFFEQRYGCIVGLSDHSGSIYPGLAATTIGAKAVELHVTFSRETFGPDVSSSVTIEELKELVKGIRYIEKMLANPLDKDVAAEEVRPLRSLFGKSVVAKVHLPAGTVLRAENLALKKPGTGIPASRLQDLLGLRIVRAVEADEQLQEIDLQQG